MMPIVGSSSPAADTPDPGCRLIAGRRVPGNRQAGHLSADEFIAATVKLSEARIGLAEFQGRHEAVVEELRNIVKLYTNMKETVGKMIDAGKRSRGDIYKVESALLEAKIRLAKAGQ